MIKMQNYLQDDAFVTFLTTRLLIEHCILCYLTPPPVAGLGRGAYM